MSSSKIFLYLCLAFIGGIFLSSFFQFTLAVTFIILILGLILISVLFGHKKSVVLGFCLIFLLLGALRYQMVESEIEKSNLANIEGSIILTGMISEEPLYGGKSGQLVIETDGGKVLVAADKYPQYHYGDVLRVKGNLEIPSEDINGFNYRDYLEKDGIISVMRWPEIELLGSRANPLFSGLLSLKDKLEESISRTLPFPQSGVVEALLFGDESNVPDSLKEKFNIIGIRHITAVSGMNITIISALILNFLLLLGLSRRPAFYFSIVLIIFYILMIGAPSSALRAGIMGCLFLAAQHFGRLAAAPRLIVISAAFMLLFNPLLLRLDVGFQLSFLAVMGLIYLQPILAVFLRKVPNFFQLNYSLTATLSAQAFTLPILIYNFGRLSLVGSLANILIVPLITFITILGFIAALAGMTFLPLGYVLSLPLWLLLTYILKLTDYFSGLSFASLVLRDVPWFLPVVLYAILAYLIWRWREKEKLKILKN